MIIEMLLEITKEQTLVAAWEFSQSIWDNKEKQIRVFIFDILSTQEVEFEESTWQGNIVLKIKGKPFQFYDVQNGFNDYFKSVGAKILVE